MGTGGVGRGGGGEGGAGGGSVGGGLEVQEYDDGRRICRGVLIKWNFLLTTSLPILIITNLQSSKESQAKTQARDSIYLNWILHSQSN